MHWGCLAKPCVSDTSGSVPLRVIADAELVQDLVLLQHLHSQCSCERSGVNMDKGLQRWSRAWQ